MLIPRGVLGYVESKRTDARRRCNSMLVMDSSDYS